MKTIIQQLQSRIDKTSGHIYSLHWMGDWNDLTKEQKHHLEDWQRLDKKIMAELLGKTKLEG